MKLLKPQSKSGNIAYPVSAILILVLLVSCVYQPAAFEIHPGKIKNNIRLEYIKRVVLASHHPDVWNPSRRHVGENWLSLPRTWSPGIQNTDSEVFARTSKLHYAPLALSSSLCSHSQYVPFLGEEEVIHQIILFRSISLYFSAVRDYFRNYSGLIVWNI